TKVQDSRRLTKLRKDMRTNAIAALAFGASMALIAIGVFVFFTDFFAKAKHNPQTKDLASALWWFIFLLIPCNGMSVATAVYALRYLRAEQKLLTNSP